MPQNKMGGVTFKKLEKIFHCHPSEHGTILSGGKAFLEVSPRDHYRTIEPK